MTVKSRHAAALVVALAATGPDAWAQAEGRQNEMTKFRYGFRHDPMK